MKKWPLLVAFAVAIGSTGAIVALRRGKTALPVAAPTEGAETLAGARASVPLELAESIFDGKLGDGWEDWGWGPHQLAPAPAKIRFSSYGGIILHHAPLEPRYGGLTFRYRAPAEFPDFLAVSLKGRESFPQISVAGRHTATLPDGTREVLIPFSELNPRNAVFDRVVINARVNVPGDWVTLERIALTKSSPGDASGPAPIRPVELVVSCRGATHAIDPMVYGGSMAVWDAAQPVQRIGGNPLTRMNWDASVWNVGSDWFFENGKAPPLRELLGAASSHGGPSALVVPTIGWVAKDAESVGFPKSKFKDQRKFDPNRPDAGDGFRPNGSPLKPGDPSQTSVPAPPELIGRWIRELRQRDLAESRRSVGMYILDNEPSLWDRTHRDVHPEPVSYDELLDRTIKYGSEIRKADPEAVIAGPAEWGWTAYFDSAKDRDSGVDRPDRRAHGDVPLIPWYLKKLAENERSTGTKILNVLDVHFYPAADRLYGDGARVDAEGAALRVRSTRALWDPSYRDESWISEPIRLIPRLKEWVAASYPGLRVSLGEWSFGAEEHISGGVATAEALGRFGQQGLDSAFYWGGPKAGSAAFWAFRAFRNFDGAGSRFQDISLPTEEQENISLFASRDADGTRLVAVLVNRDPMLAMRARVRLDGCGKANTYRAFAYGSGSKALEQLPTKSVEIGSVTETLQPFSFAVLDIRMTTSKP